ncbi:hypothetical protein B4119_0610 [Parageobacillus caldoxylosilyticus]|uniref:Uncharacterized protein n=1 Tax=Saccharococcus caldoxylosilyticus TaxID=81408 RepID=A0A150L3E0_9BACL|nr:hypothetical protein B4119_0610 [Parageobacillus caldoxylosilyticus]
MDRYFVVVLTARMQRHFLYAFVKEVAFIFMKRGGEEDVICKKSEEKS